MIGSTRPDHDATVIVMTIRNQTAPPFFGLLKFPMWSERTKPPIDGEIRPGKMDLHREYSASRSGRSLLSPIETANASHS